MIESTNPQVLWRQFQTLFLLSIRRYSLSKTSISLMAFAFWPIPLVIIFAAALMYNSGFGFTNPLDMDGTGRNLVDVEETRILMQVVVRLAYLNFGIFFASLIFGNAYLKEEIEEQTLHYLFQQPIPRYMIFVSKFAGFLSIAIPIFVTGLIICQILVAIPFGFSGFKELFIDDGRLWNLGIEILVISLAFVMFSSLFALLSTFFNNPVYALFLFGWEIAVSYLPAALKYFTISHYLRHLLPESFREQSTEAIGTMSDPPGLLLTSVVIIVLLGLCFSASYWLLRRRECIYSGS